MRFLKRFAILLVAVMATGCAENRALQEDLVDFKNESALTLQLLEEHDNFLKEKFETVSEALDTATNADRSLERNFNAYHRRPDEVKIEVLDELDRRAEEMVQQQVDFSAESNRRLEQAFQDLDRRKNEEIESLLQRLEHEDQFFRFVFTAQDSVNGEFASRFDSRPWYESVLGGWEEAEEQATEPQPAP